MGEVRLKSWNKILKHNNTKHTCLFKEWQAISKLNKVSVISLLNRHSWSCGSKYVFAYTISYMRSCPLHFRDGRDNSKLAVIMAGMCDAALRAHCSLGRKKDGLNWAIITNFVKKTDFILILQCSYIVTPVAPHYNTVIAPLFDCFCSSYFASCNSDVEFSIPKFMLKYSFNVKQ